MENYRLAKGALSQINLKEDDATARIGGCDGKVEVEKNKHRKYFNLQERLESFYNRSLDEIYIESMQEVDVGDPVGREQW